MKLRNLLAVIAVLAPVAGAVPAAAKVEVVQTSSPALAEGSTFTLVSMRAIGLGLPDPAIANEITADRLRTVTEAALASRGYRQIADPDEADLIVAYTIVMRPETDGKLRSDRAGCTLPFCAGPGDYSLDTSHYTEGTLVLDLVERRTGRLVWRATSKKRVTGNDVSEKKLTALLKGMTSSLPVK